MIFSLLKLRTLILEYKIRIINIAHVMFEMSNRVCGILSIRLKVDSVCQHQ